MSQVKEEQNQGNGTSRKEPASGKAVSGLSPEKCDHGTPKNVRCERCVNEGVYTYAEPRKGMEADNKQIRLTRTMLEQLKTYVDDRDSPDGHGGWYYGNREQFEKRHQVIRAWLTQEIERTNTPSSAERPRP